MMMRLLGTVPVSAINIGLVAGISGLQAKITELQADITSLGLTAGYQAEFALNPPNLADLTLGVAVQLSSLADLLNKLQFAVNAGVAVNGDLLTQLGFIEIQLALVGKIAASFEAGLSAGSLAAWTYAGNACGFGQTMRGTSKGWGHVSSGAEINAIVIATESFESWGQFSLGFNTGSTSKARVSSDSTKLTFLGSLNAERLNTGVARIAKDLNLYLLDLNGAKVNLEYQLEVSLGAELPELGELEVGLDVDLELVLDDMIHMKMDVQADIGTINLQINGILSLIAELNAQLTAGGLSVWLYSGSAGGLGDAIASVTQAGLPGASGPTAPVYGLVVATELPEVWAGFTTIFGIAA